MGEKKNAGFIHVITGININTILSEKNPYRKGHPDPIFTMSALNPSSLSKSLKISVTL